MAGVIVLDASALIAMQVNTDSNYAWANDFMHSTLAFDYAMSAMTYAEVLVHPARSNSMLEYQSRVVGLQIELVPLGIDDVEHLAQIRAETKLLMPDAIAIQTAEKLGAGIATADSQLAKTAIARGLEVYSPSKN